MKKALSLAVSSLALLSLFSVNNAALAGKKKNKKSHNAPISVPMKQRSKDLEFILKDEIPKAVSVAPLSESELAQHLEHSSPLNISRLPKDLSFHILSYLDPQSLIRVYQVCKPWWLLNSNFSQHLAESFLRDLETQDMVKFPTHPTSIISIAETLKEELEIKDYPKSLLTLTYDPSQTNLSLDRDQASSISRLIVVFQPEIGGSIEDFKPLARLFAKKYVRLSPVDWKSVGFAADVALFSPTLKNYLKTIAESTKFDTTKIESIFRDLPNHREKQIHMMATKLLALSGDSESQEALSTFDEKLVEFYRTKSGPAFTHNENDELVLQKNYSYLKESPLWAAYTDKIRSLSEGINLSDLLLAAYSSNYQHKPNANNIEQLYEYIKILYPHTLPSTIPFHLVEFYAAEGDEKKKEKTLGTMLEMAQVGKYSELAWAAEACINEEFQLEHIKEILENKLSQYQTSSARFEILNYLVEIALELGTESELDKAESYLTSLNQEINKSKKRLINIDHEGYKTTIDEAEIQQSQLVLALYKGQFAVATKVGKKLEELFINNTVLKALERQLEKKASIPTELRKILKNFLNETLENLWEDRKEIENSAGEKKYIKSLLSERYPLSMKLLLENNDKGNTLLNKILILISN